MTDLHPIARAVADADRFLNEECVSRWKKGGAEKATHELQRLAESMFRSPSGDAAKVEAMRVGWSPIDDNAKSGNDILLWDGILYATVGYWYSDKGARTVTTEGWIDCRKHRVGYQEISPVNFKFWMPAPWDIRALPIDPKSPVVDREAEIENLNGHLESLRAENHRLLDRCDKYRDELRAAAKISCEDALVIVDRIRSQNWKNGGVLTMDREEAADAILALFNPAETGLIPPADREGK